MTVPIIKKLDVGQPIPEGYELVEAFPDGSKAIVRAGLMGAGADINAEDNASKRAGLSEE